MDGVRGYWNGLILLTRQGNKIHCPKWFTEEFPSIALDGELWMGRDTHSATVTTILNSKDGDWNQIGYHIYDIPSSDAIYEERMKIMESLKPSLPPHVHIVENIQRTGIEHPKQHLSSVVIGKGEGLMLRKPQTIYQQGYTSSVLKVKVRVTHHLILFLGSL